MKKILLLINDYHVPAVALALATEVATNCGATLFGLFIQALRYNDQESYGFPSDIHLTDSDFTSASDKEERLQYLQASQKLFADHCSALGVAFQMVNVEDKFMDVVIDNSAFADLVVCSGDTLPQLYSLNSVLAHVHCPVLLVNNDYRQVDSLIFAYDDNLSSIYAIRTFTYLLGQYKHLPVHFVSVLPPNILGLEYQDLLDQWLSLHYPGTSVTVLKGDTKEELTKYVNKAANPLLVMGAYGRNSLSRFFKESLANSIMQQTNVPIFIAHN